MNICMAGIDHSTAGVEIRERFSLTQAKIQEVYEQLKQKENIYGTVILSTCNRTEIYMSCEDGIIVNPFEEICKIYDIFDIEKYKNAYKLRYGDDVIEHLCKLACGVKSQIWGEDQIITQVKNAVAFSRENKAADSILEVLFRTAVTCAKKIKTELKLSSPQNSIAYKTLSLLQRYKQEGKKIDNVLVIGNGEIGRLTAEMLCNNGFCVTMTLRRYKHSDNIVPDGCNSVEYNDRYSVMPQYDAVVSATSSPHYTVSAEELNNCEVYPKLFVDLAVPRDIEPEVENINGVKVYNVDSLCGEEIEQDHQRQLEQIQLFIEKYKQDFKDWYVYKQKAQLQSVYSAV